MTAYRTDFYRWAMEQAAALSGRQAEDLDWPHLAKEMELVADGVALHLETCFEDLVEALLEWGVTTERWPKRRLQSRIHSARPWIQGIVRASPSLYAELTPLLIERYLECRHRANSATGVPLVTWPEHCPWTVEQVLAADFWPEPLCTAGGGP